MLATQNLCDLDPPVMHIKLYVLVTSGQNSCSLDYNGTNSYIFLKFTQTFIFGFYRISMMKKLKNFNYIRFISTSL
jgi:hypothetical protein